MARAGNATTSSRRHPAGLRCPAMGATGHPHGGRERSWVLDVPVDLGRPEDLLDRIRGWVGEGRAEPRQVLYANAHVLNRALGDPELREALEQADLVTCDGVGVQLAARALDRPVPDRMTAADWIWGLAATCAQAGHAVFLLGSAPGVAQRAAQALEAACPGLRVAGHHHGFFALGSPEEDRVVEAINAARPGIVLVGMGTPKQELWIRRTAHRLDADVLWSVGALFDVVSGAVPRAPGVLTDHGLEWIFRLAIEPGRMWRRYLLGNPAFVGRVLGARRAR